MDEVLLINTYVVVPILVGVVIGIFVGAFATVKYIKRRK
ncbi:Secreted protein with PEP-CTERM sorting signal [Vibrio crassostreae]|nr:hypothetical protein EDB37_101977 [Vibrio crassostreae]CAK2485217.1 Secreted protein with PEP-CTERM sorting signal [Vibrio crassostreae]CAK2987643.1 Secreted protein with PEP-CTERM sorting signal [Vibrio crassostreae]CAK3732732.1 Secreted protein with PEP-CTERM sorting signal [Vibrio crassostreae]